MKKTIQKIWLNPNSTLPITQAELENLLGIKIDMEKLDDIHGELKTIGDWNIPTSYRALAMSAVFGEYSKYESVTVYGMRTMTNCRQSGYQLEGYASINGKKYSCFTSSQLFEFPDGKLINIAVIHARVK
jgi:hypothetical protein